MLSSELRHGCECVPIVERGIRTPAIFASTYGNESIEQGISQSRWSVADLMQWRMLFLSSLELGQNRNDKLQVSKLCVENSSRDQCDAF